MAHLRIFSCVLLAAVSVAALPAQAQNQSPPPLRDFSLQPEPKEEPPSKVQGPVVDGQRPRDLTQPPRSTQPQNAPQTQPRRTSPEASPPAATAQTPQQTRPAPARTAPAQTAPSRPAVTPRAQQNTSDTITDNTPAPQEQIIPVDTNAPAVPPVTEAADDTAPAAEEIAPAGETGQSSIPVWVYILGALAVLAMLVYMFLRRRKSASARPVVHDTTQNEDPPATQPSPPVALGGNPKKPVPALSAAPKSTQPAPAMPSPAFSSASGKLAIEFIAESAGATLMNAVLGYRIIVRSGDRAVKNIKLSGVMLQAANGSDKVPDTLYQPLHELAEVNAAGESELKGEIRLPLAQIQPITYNRQALFVPVAHFALEYTDRDGAVQRDRYSFIVGREHEPPRAKMAPFRLDLGPRTFRGVGQRPLAAG